MYAIRSYYAPNKNGQVISLEELFLLHLHNSNPAALPLEKLFDDAPLEQTAYEKLVTPDQPGQDDR